MLDKLCQSAKVLSRRVSDAGLRGVFYGHQGVRGAERLHLHLFRRRLETR